MAEKIGIYFGSSTGATERIANMLKNDIEATGVATCDVQVVSGGNLKTMENYKYLLLGCPTWNIGELQDDWAIVYPVMDTVNWKGRKVGFFGCGDQFGYSNSFNDSIGILCEKVVSLGGEPVGCYQCEFSCGEFVKVFMGLFVDEDNQAPLSPQRVINWAHWVLEDMGLLKPEAAAA